MLKEKDFSKMINQIKNYTLIGKTPLFNLARFFPRAEADLNFKKN